MDIIFIIYFVLVRSCEFCRHLPQLEGISLLAHKKWVRMGATKTCNYSLFFEIKIEMEL